MKPAGETSAAAPSYAKLLPGDPAPWFRQASGSNESFVFSTMAGRYVVLCFFGSAADPRSRAALEAIAANRALFDDRKLCCFGITIDPRDRSEGRVADMLPGIRHFWDFDGAVSRLYGARPQDGEIGRDVRLRRFWMVLDPALRVRAVFPFAADGSERDKVFAYLSALPPVPLYAGIEIPAPIIVIPDVFEPELCRHLIGLYEQHGGEESGFMREIDGRTTSISDPSFKRRKDYVIEDAALKQHLQHRIVRRVNPEIEKVHFFKPTRMERYIVACYAAEDGGHFQPHRDNTTKGTAHRRFAVSINLNSAFEGGEVSFPEYSPKGFKAPPGGAVVFSTPLLHAVSKVTRGRRYAFLPFLYDDAAAKIREANNAYLAEGVGEYGGKGS